MVVSGIAYGVVWAALVLAPGPGPASPKTDVAAAKRLYTIGEQHMAAGRATDAVPLWRKVMDPKFSDYAIYEAPSSSCSPPTAPPGTSNHEQGTAIDFTCNGGGTLSSSSSCFSWLKSNAASYGFYNLPSEPWHWSVDGT